MKSSLSDTDLLLNFRETHSDLSESELIEWAIKRNEGKLSSTGALSVNTGKYTGRSPEDKFIVVDSETQYTVDWTNNQPFSEDAFEALFQKVIYYIENQPDKFVFNGLAGAEANTQLPLQVITEYAWHNLFARQLFIKPEKPLKNQDSKFTVISVPGFEAVPEKDGTNSEAFVIISFKKKVVLIGGTEYAGEIKKSIFTVMNYLLPQSGILSMHCSANIDDKGDTALFFGLSGTGKTTLSNTAHRQLIGDDEHGWSSDGVFNIEGGCYAKTINLSKEHEPQIWNAIRYGTILENVILDPITRESDFRDNSLTENTRAAYPLEHIDNVVKSGKGTHPKTIIFLTADAFGVLPPISLLTKDQAAYYFLSGYTSKLAGTERGVSSPEATFSSCFGSPFLPLSPTSYADLLSRKIDEHNVNVYLVNTGWSGGQYGVGERINLSYTRKMVEAALSGELLTTEWNADPIFGLRIPSSCPGVPSSILQPILSWSDPVEYEKVAQQLATQFKNNFNKFKNVSQNIINAGPK